MIHIPDARSARFRYRLLSVLPACLTLLVLLFVSTFRGYAQPPEAYDEDGNLIVTRAKGFTMGISMGAYWPNKNSASLYDGYGYNAFGEKNNFETSWMNQKINIQYGDNNPSGYDYVADALGVQPGEWNFDESDMPVNMRYNTAITIGFAGRYSLDGVNGILLNAIFTEVTAAGNFTITTRPPPGSTQVNNSIRTYNIRGKEQRILFQAGYQRLLGESQSFNLLMEGGLHATLAKFDENEIEIENLRINLIDDYYDFTTGYTFFTGSRPVALGFGAFAGLGVNLDVSPKWALQLVYNLNLENVRIAFNPKLGINQAVNLRAYYKL